MRALFLCLCLRITPPPRLYLCHRRKRNIFWYLWTSHTVFLLSASSVSLRRRSATGHTWPAACAVWKHECALMTGYYHDHIIWWRLVKAKASQSFYPTCLIRVCSIRDEQKQVGKWSWGNPVNSAFSVLWKTSSEVFIQRAQVFRANTVLHHHECLLHTWCHL